MKICLILFFIIFFNFFYIFFIYLFIYLFFFFFCLSIFYNSFFENLDQQELTDLKGILGKMLRYRAETPFTMYDLLGDTPSRGQKRQGQIFLSYRPSAHKQGAYDSGSLSCDITFYSVDTVLSLLPEGSKANFLSFKESILYIYIYIYIFIYLFIYLLLALVFPD